MTSGFARRFGALLRKEVRQLLRDRSNLAVGLVLPVVLILLFGYGLSLDVKNVPVAVVLEDSSAEARDLVSAFQLSPYFAPRLTPSMGAARKLILDRDVDAILRIRSDFARNLALGNAQVQLAVHGTDANTARIIEAYGQGAVAQWAARRAAHWVTAPWP